MKLIGGFLPLTILLSLCSCSAINHPEVSNIVKDEGAVILQKSSLEAETREPIFVYNNQSKIQPKKVLLAINDKPQLLGDGYVRLLGVVMGNSLPIALVEISGKERCLRQGERCNGYYISSIRESGIRLARKER